MNKKVLFDEARAFGETVARRWAKTKGIKGHVVYHPHVWIRFHDPAAQTITGREWDELKVDPSETIHVFVWVDHYVGWAYGETLRKLVEPRVVDGRKYPFFWMGRTFVSLNVMEKMAEIPPDMLARLRMVSGETWAGDPCPVQPGLPGTGVADHHLAHKAIKLRSKNNRMNGGGG